MNVNGPYSVVRVEAEDDSDGIVFTTLKWGYDEREQALEALPEIAEDKGLSVEDLAIVRTWFGHDLLEGGEVESKG